MARRARLDVELVRRKLVTSRERAAEAISAGRVRVGGVTATKPATMVDASASIVLAVGDDPGYASRGAHKLVGAFEAFGVPAPEVPEPGIPGSAGIPGSGGAAPESGGSAEPLPASGGSAEPLPVRAGSAEPLVEPPQPPQPQPQPQPQQPQPQHEPRDLPAHPAHPALVVAGRRCLDVGASTGGFTDVLLRYGAREVVAVDVGYGQLVWRLRADPRVRVLDRTNARHLAPDQVGEPVDLVVGDLSFISLVLVLPALRACAGPDADFVLLVKPQFEVGREFLGAGGVVRDVALHAGAVRSVAAAAAELGLGVCGVTASPLPGPAGNVEYLLWLRADVVRGAGEIEAMTAAAIAAGPAGPAPATPPVAHPSSPYSPRTDR
ncbi:TlyA family RNA methyltransferase [Parafrankia sp. EUN1f]|uniref:TlyA family RNA methyltransferase n=1 Tax=Parafrankia sp. EUN1f TaxID=102897 RepID=UPI0001C43F53|nr:TlyA family RNA methyltransferase [Parafrankia sp. EUN1f]EFC82531.1 RNA-binding S4 domain protein [Parafrankia sp. EUN1f]